MTEMSDQCVRCHETMATRDGQDPTPECDSCAHEMVERLRGYDNLYSTETSGSANYGIKVLVRIDRPFTNEDVSCASKVSMLLAKHIATVSAANDPKIKAQAQTEKEAFQSRFEEAGLGPIYMKAIPNEYWPYTYVKEIMMSPWYMVTTHSGHFKIGWRKNVIVLDWEQTNIPGSANQYFPAEDVTKGDRMVHCHGYDKMVEYLKVLAAVQVESWHS